MVSIKPIFKVLFCAVAIPFVGLADQIDVTVRQGVELSELNWNIASSTGEPNILSELSWKDLQGWNSQILIEAALSCHTIARFEGSYTKLYKGRNTDFDYGADDRQKVFAESWASAKEGELFDLSLALGYRLEHSCRSVHFIPLIGYSVHDQHVQMNSPAHYRDTGPNDPFDPVPGIYTGEIDGLHSSYKARWRGPWAGLDVTYDLNCFQFITGLEYHWLNYKGSGHWNLRSDFADDFHHYGDANGVKVKAGGTFTFCRCWHIEVLATFFDFRLRNGLNQITVFDEGEIARGESRLNEVNFRAATFTLGIGAGF